MRDGSPSSTETPVESAERWLMSELFLICQPSHGEVFAFVDDHKTELVAGIIKAYEEAATKKRLDDMHNDPQYQDFMRRRMSGE